jgi:hypothetical protein
LKFQIVFFTIFSFVLCRADASDIGEFLTNSKQEVAYTKKKLSSKDGLFGDFNYKGTLIREARPDERNPASAEINAGN